MAALSLFPAHLAFVDRDGKLTAEAYRALITLYERVGGPFGDQGVDVFGGGVSGDDYHTMGIIHQPFEEGRAVKELTQPVTDAQNQEEMVLQPTVTGSAIQTIILGASPYTYRTQTQGTLSVIGGTMSDLSLTRAGMTISLATSTPMIPLSPGDAVSITYTVAPALKLIPR